MILEAIKTLLGEELTKSVETALKGKGKEGKDVDLVVGNDGTYVPAEKFDLAKGQATSAETALKSAADALKGIGGSGDPAKIAEDVKTATDKISGLQTQHDTEMKKMQKITALKLALADEVYDPNDIIANIDLEKIDLNESGSLKTDAKTILEPFQKTKPYLFKTKNNEDDGKNKDGEGKPKYDGWKPAPAGDQASGTQTANPKSLEEAVKNSLEAQKG